MQCNRTAIAAMCMAGLLLAGNAVAQKAPAAQLPLPPTGYKWVEFPAGKLTILKPLAWFEKKELVKGTFALSLSKEYIMPGKMFQTGMTYNYVTNVTQKAKVAPSKYAAAMMDGIARKYGGPNRPIRDDQGGLTLIRFLGVGPNRVHVAHLLIANDGKDDLRTFTCEAPETVWKSAAQKQCSTMFSTFLIL